MENNKKNEEEIIENPKSREVGTTDPEILSNDDKLKIKKNIETLQKHEYMRIYYILQGSKEIYTTNRNGVWFNFNSLKLSTQQKIYEYVNMCVINNTKYNI